MGSSTHLDKKAPERRFNKPHKTCVEEKEMGIIPDGDARHPGLHVKQVRPRKHVKSIATKWARNGSGWGAGLALLFPSFFSLGLPERGFCFRSIPCCARSYCRKPQSLWIKLDSITSIQGLEVSLTLGSKETGNDMEIASTHKVPTILHQTTDFGLRRDEITSMYQMCPKIGPSEPQGA